MIDTNFVILSLFTDAILKARALNTAEELEKLIGETVPKITRAFHRQDQLLNEKEVASRFGQSLNVTRLRNFRARGKGPRYIKMGKHRNSRVYYRISDIENWLAEQQRLTGLLIKSPLASSVK